LVDPEGLPCQTVSTVTVFLSYSREDHFFAELAEIQLQKFGIELWRDHGQLRPGDEWRKGIEKGMADSLAVLVALSPNSAQSPYVTFEWAYALGQKKVVLPLRLASCSVHPRLETIQYLDFGVPGAYPWGSLAEQILEIETTEAQKDAAQAAREQKSELVPEPEDPVAKAILGYLDQRGYQMASLERLQRRVDENLTQERLQEIIKQNPTFFRDATIEGRKPGIAKLIP
jgi:hypothetical protein